MDTRVLFDIYTGVLSWQKSQHPLGHLSIWLLISIQSDIYIRTSCKRIPRFTSRPLICDMTKTCWNAVKNVLKIAFSPIFHSDAMKFHRTINQRPWGESTKLLQRFCVNHFVVWSISKYLIAPEGVFIPSLENRRKTRFLARFSQHFNRFSSYRKSENGRWIYASIYNSFVYIALLYNQ